MNILTDNLDPIEIGYRLKKERKRLGLSQSGLAEKCGVSRPSISLFEVGSRFPSTKFLLKFSEIGCDLDYILEGTGLLAPEPKTERAEILKAYEVKLDELYEEQSLIEENIDTAINTLTQLRKAARSLSNKIGRLQREIKEVI